MQISFVHYVNPIKYNEIKFINSYILYNDRNNSTVKQINNNAYLDILNISEEWSKNFDLNKKENSYILSAINEHLFIYTYIRIHMDNNKISKIKYKNFIRKTKIKKNYNHKKNLFIINSFSIFLY